jgi:hypothetical protein
LSSSSTRLYTVDAVALELPATSIVTRSCRLPARPRDQAKKPKTRKRDALADGVSGCATESGRGSQMSAIRSASSTPHYSKPG